MSTTKRRIWGIGVIVFFGIMCGLIYFSTWWAYNKNVPAYERARTHATP